MKQAAIEDRDLQRQRVNGRLEVLLGWLAEASAERSGLDSREHAVTKSAVVGYRVVQTVPADVWPRIRAAACSGKFGESARDQQNAFFARGDATPRMGMKESFPANA
ncbi:hypothetical protein [Rhizobium gallicum]|uniref:hypothetical protein n=1 Tax=Rhizobium gallicum TaxID=56730 RepID=UPI00142D292C|nr:hypothetical protein [Rhizobium gallicum]